MIEEKYKEFLEVTHYTSESEVIDSMQERTSDKAADTQHFFGIEHCGINEANLIVLGICWDRSSSYRRGASAAPPMIRAATTGKLYNSFTEKMVDLQKKWKIFDAGDIGSRVRKIQYIHNDIQKLCKSMPQDGRNYLFLGGDHIITYLSTKALVSCDNDRWGLLYLDTHPDLYDSYEGNLYSHACVVRRIIEEEIIPAMNVLEVGIRAPTPEQMNYAQQKNVKMISTSAIFDRGAKKIADDIVDYFSGKIDKLYLSVDLDILDPSVAPGVGNPEAGGVTTRDIVEIVQGISNLNIQAFDIVELSPPFDCSNMTAYAAAKIIRELLGEM